MKTANSRSFNYASYPSRAGDLSTNQSSQESEEDEALTEAGADDAATETEDEDLDFLSLEPPHPVNTTAKREKIRILVPINVFIITTI